MKEDLIHLVWKMKNFDLQNLRTTEGEIISINKFGTHNFDSGPDFLNAEIKIGDKIWIGHVEMHVKASEWYEHKHQNDPAYQNVILHVVYTNDKPVHNHMDQVIPTLVLNQRIDSKTIENYDNLKSSLSWVPCADQLKNIDEFKLNIFLERILVERLERKAVDVFGILADNQNDWESTLYSLLSKYLGLKVNAEAFSILNQKTSYKLVLKYSSNLLDLESLLYGQAGLLKNYMDEYSKNLHKRYEFIQCKHTLVSMNGVEWKFSRMRPVNFPTIRISQLSAIYNKSPQLFNKLINCNSLNELYALLNVSASEYWNTHYTFGKESLSTVKNLGDEAKKILIINALVPLFFTYGIKRDDQNIKDLAVSFLNDMKSENNRIIRKWKEHGISSNAASKSQALIELKNNYCDQFKCLNCNIGRTILFA